MPIVAVAGAFMGASALAAGGLTVWGTISAIGGIIGGIGALTGNEDMMKIGGIAGLAGGVGAFASGQGWLASGSTNSAMADTGGNIAKMIDAPTPGLENVNPTDMRLAAGTQTTPMEGGAGLAESTGSLDSGIAQSISQPNNLVSDSPPTSAGGGLIDAANPNDSYLAAGTKTSPAASEGAQSLVRPAVSAKPGAEGGGILGTLKKFSAFLDENKTLAKMGGDFIGGLFDENKKAQTELLKARAETERQQLANGSAIPNMNFKLKPHDTIFRPGTPTYNAPRPAGLFYAK